jgi:hypothetical protein
MIRGNGIFYKKKYPLRTTPLRERYASEGNIIQTNLLPGNENEKEDFL